MTEPRQQRRYVKSTRSGGSGGNCVEWAHERTAVFVRDSKHPDGPELTVSHTQWSQFLATAHTGQAHPWIEPTQSGVLVSKDRLQLSFTPAEWTAFVEAIVAGECSALAPAQAIVPDRFDIT